MSDERLKKALRLKHTVPDPAQSECSFNHLHVHRTSKGLAQSSQQELTAESTFVKEISVKGWKSSVMIPPLLGDIKDKIDKDPQCPNSGQSKLDDNCGCYSFKRKARRTQQLWPAPLLMQKWLGWCSRMRHTRAAWSPPPKTKHSNHCLLAPQDSYSFYKNESHTILLWNQNLNACPPQHHFFPH